MTFRTLAQEKRLKFKLHCNGIKKEIYRYKDNNFVYPIYKKKKIIISNELLVYIILNNEFELDRCLERKIKIKLNSIAMGKTKKFIYSKMTISLI